MKKIEHIDISGDVGLRIRGRSLEELFENAAAGMFNLMTDVSNIMTSEQREVDLRADNYENMLVQWLNELVFLFDTYGFIGKKCQISLKNDSLKSTVSGGIFNPRRDERKLLIKAATYHNLTLNKTASCWEATIIFDI